MPSSGRAVARQRDRAAGEQATADGDRVQHDVGELADARREEPLEGLVAEPAIKAASAGATIAEASGRSRQTRRNSQAMTPNSTKWTRSTARIAGSALPVAAE